MVKSEKFKPLLFKYRVNNTHFPHFTDLFKLSIIFIDLLLFEHYDLMYLIVSLSRYRAKLMQMREKYRELQAKHIRLNKTLKKKAEIITKIRREKSDIQKKYNELLKAYKTITNTKASVCCKDLIEPIIFNSNLGFIFTERSQRNP